LTKTKVKRKQSNPPRKWLTSDFKQKINELAAQGKTQSQISKSLRIPPTTVRNYIQRNKIETTRQYKERFVPTDEQLTMVYEMFANGDRVIDIAKQIGVGKDAMTRLVERLKLSRPPIKRGSRLRVITPDEEKTLRSFVLAGETRRQICQKMRVDAEIIQRWCDELELDLKKKFSHFKPTEDIEKLARRLVADGASRSRIAHQIGISIPTATKYLEQLGLSVEPRGWRYQATAKINAPVVRDKPEKAKKQSVSAPPKAKPRNNPAPKTPKPKPPREITEKEMGLAKGEKHVSIAQRFRVLGQKTGVELVTRRA
jgi:DNA-binding CsgD family transcriptional regulator